MPQETKLMPCPFCGGEAEIIGERLQIHHKHGISKCPMNPIIFYKEDISKWNTRATPPTSPVQKCTCGNDSDPSIQHRYNGLPCYVISPTSPDWIKEACNEIAKEQFGDDCEHSAPSIYEDFMNVATQILTKHAAGLVEKGDK